MDTLEGLWLAEVRGPAGRRATWSIEGSGPDGAVEHRADTPEGPRVLRWSPTGVATARELALQAGDRVVRLERRDDVLFVQGPDGVERFRLVRADVKQVIVYRRDLQMRKGKIAAQVAHASMKVLLDRDEGPWDRLEIPMDPVMAAWTRARFAKVVLSVDDEVALLEAHRLAREQGIPTALVTDAGRTEFHGVPTRTTVAIGPAPADAIDRITGPEGAVRTKLA